MNNRFLLMTIGLFFFLTLNAQQTDDFKKTKLIPGFPSEIEFMRDQMNLGNVSQSSFKTGIDSLEVKFGEFTQNNSKGYWISLFSNKNLLALTTVVLNLDEESGFLTNVVSLKFNNSSKKISVKVKHDPVTDGVLYQWVTKHGSSSVAVIETIERLIQENKLMPQFGVKTLDGVDLSLDDFKGKYLVLNWWATTCGPCIAEMPGLNELVEKFKLRRDVVFVAIAWDEKEKIENFLSKRDFKYRQTLGNKEVIRIFGESFPKHIIINPTGVVTYYSEGGNIGKHLDIEKCLNNELNK